MTQKAEKGTEEGMGEMVASRTAHILCQSRKAT